MRFCQQPLLKLPPLTLLARIGDIIAAIAGRAVAVSDENY
jgi:hypothetical protein